MGPKSPNLLLRGLLRFVVNAARLDAKLIAQDDAIAACAPRGVAISCWASAVLTDVRRVIVHSVLGRHTAKNSMAFLSLSRVSDVRFWHLADIGTASENVCS